MCDIIYRKGKTFSYDSNDSIRKDSAMEKIEHIGFCMELRFTELRHGLLLHCLIQDDPETAEKLSDLIEKYTNGYVVGGQDTNVQGDEQVRDFFFPCSK